VKSGKCQSSPVISLCKVRYLTTDLCEANPWIAVEIHIPPASSIDYGCCGLVKSLLLESRFGSRQARSRPCESCWWSKVKFHDVYCMGHVLKITVSKEFLLESRSHRSAHQDCALLWSESPLSFWQTLFQWLNLGSFSVEPCGYFKTDPWASYYSTAWSILCLFACSRRGSESWVFESRCVCIHIGRQCRLIRRC
jgi:hypothetical protein